MGNEKILEVVSLITATLQGQGTGHGHNGYDIYARVDVDSDLLDAINRKVQEHVSPTGYAVFAGGAKSGMDTAGVSCILVICEGEDEEIAAIHCPVVASLREDVNDPVSPGELVATRHSLFEIVNGKCGEAKFIKGTQQAMKLVQRALFEAVQECVNGIEVEREKAIRALADMFKVGAEVRIKCEGRDGVIRAVDHNEKLATVAVGGKGLKYRYEDLVIR